MSLFSGTKMEMVYYLIVNARLRRAHDCPIARPELATGADAGALQANNSFVPGTPNAGIDAAWGREAANLHNQPVQLKFRNCGFKRADTGTGIKLTPVNAQFIRSQVLPTDEWDIFQRVLGGFARTYTKQQAVSREKLDAAPAIKAIYFSFFENSPWTVMYTASLLTSEDVKSKIKALRGQFDVMFGFYQPLLHPVVHHFASGPLALNTKLLNYGTAKDQMPSAGNVDRIMTVLGLCFDTLKEGDRPSYNAAFHELMVDYNKSQKRRKTK